MDFFRRAAQVVGSLTQLAANMRECAVYAEQFAQMINGIPWTGNPAAFPALANGQYMPVMPPMAMAHDDHGRKRKSRGGDELDGKRRQKKPRDPNAPKRPPSSYLLFQNDVRAELKAKNPQMRNNELLSAISKLWSEMPQQQKDVCALAIFHIALVRPVLPRRNTRHAIRPPRTSGWWRRRPTRQYRMAGLALG